MIGKKIHSFAKELWGLNRSITGSGLRQTLVKIQDHLPELAIKSVASGTRVFDWTVPKEWEVKRAFIITPTGEKICDFQQNNLHLLGYSTPIQKTLSLEELEKHLYSLPDQPDAIPYITSYYEERWGFCISDDDRKKLVDGDYKVLIESRLFDGFLNYGELILKGETEEEIFLSTYVCHPSMANNELSGPCVVTFLAKWLKELTDRRYTYRIIFIPETIGSITYISTNFEEMKKNIIAGFNVSCVGDNRTYSYLPSRKGNTLSDQVAKHVLGWIHPQYSRFTWSDRGSDERQYCSPGVDLPVASIMRTKFHEYPEYHTSLDDLENVVTPEGLDGGYEALKKALELLEKNEVFKVSVLCEPQMGKRGMYPAISTKKSREEVKLMMDFISWCDGEHSLLDIADKLSVPAWVLYGLVEKLKSNDLIEVVNS